MMHNTYAPAIVDPTKIAFSIMTIYRFNAAYYLNGKGYRADGITPFPKVSLKASA
jgi:hypothetical protein